MSEPATDAEQQQYDWSADLALFGVALMWGINIPIMKHGVGLIDRLGFNCLRLTLSAIVLGILVLIEPRYQKKRDDQTPWAKIIAVAVVCGFVYQLLFVMGINRTLAGNTALILSVTPMWIALMAWFMGIEKLKSFAWIGLLMTCAGAGLVAFGPSNFNLGTAYLKGNLLVLAASFMWAVGAVLSKPLFDYVSPTMLAFLSAAVTLPLHYLVGMHEIGPSLEVVTSDMTALGCVAYSGAFSTGFAYALWNYGVRKVGPSHSAIYQNLVPMIALATAWILLSEVPSGSQVPGGALILLGLFVMRRGR